MMMGAMMKGLDWWGPIRDVTRLTLKVAARCVTVWPHIYLRPRTGRWCGRIRHGRHRRGWWWRRYTLPFELCERRYRVPVPVGRATKKGGRRRS